MALSTELISQFAKIVAPKKQRPESTAVTGTAKEYAGKIYVQIDGSDQLTPIASSTVGMKDGDKVTVQIKNHSATITGNASDPSAGKSYADDINNKVDDVSDQISEFEIIIADKVDVDDLNAVNGRIDNLVSENVTITGKLDAVEADIGELTADNVTINGKLDAADAEIENLKVTKLDASIADIKYATIENLEATNADIHNLEADYGSFKDLTTDNFAAVNASINQLDADKLDATEAEIKYANIDFTNIGTAAVEELFAKSGIIEDLVVSGGHITGQLVGVTISGDLIEGNTIKADKLVVLGEDGLYYKLNVNAETVGAEQTEYNSLNGSIITANTITAEKINVDDLVAFNATIGGYHITSDSLYSGAKASATNTTRGVFMNDDGEFAIGDSNNYLRFFKDTDETYKLELSANSIKMSATNTTIEEEISNIKNDVTNAGKITEKSCGEIISIGENGGKTPYSLTVYGETRQNLWMNPATRTANGVTLTNNADGTITLDGTCTANTWIFITVYNFKANTTYTLSLDKAVQNSGDAITGFYAEEFDADEASTSHMVQPGNTSITFTTKSSVSKANCAFLAYTGAVLSGTYRVMLNEGSEPEPWCPPGLNSVDELSVVCAGKNLTGAAEFDSTWETIVQPGVSGDMVDALNLLPPGVYTLSADFELTETDSDFDGTTSSYGFVFGKAAQDYLFKDYLSRKWGADAKVGDVKHYEAQFEVTEDYVGQFGVFYAYGCGVGSTGATGKAHVSSVQIELGNAATAYEPPQVTTTPIDLSGHALNSLPDGTRDELTIDATGAVTLTQRVGSLTIPTDAEDVTWDDNFKRFWFSAPNSVSVAEAPVRLMCDRVPQRLSADTAAVKTGSYVIISASQCYICVEGAESVEDALAIAGGGTVLCQLETAQEISLQSVTLPALPSDSANVWASAPVPASMCMEYWTVDGAKVADAQDAANEAAEDVSIVQSEVTEQVERINTLEQNANGFDFNFQTLTQQITEIAGQVNINYESIVKYIRFVDGVIIIGIEGNELEVRISNERVSFLQSGSEVAYISNQQLYITDAEVERQLRIGIFQFVPRDNGNLTLKYLG